MYTFDSGVEMASRACAAVGRAGSRRLRLRRRHMRFWVLVVLVAAVPVGIFYTRAALHRDPSSQQTVAVLDDAQEPWLAIDHWVMTAGLNSGTSHRSAAARPAGTRSASPRPHP